MKKLSFLLAVLLCISLLGCNSKGNDSAATDNSTTAESTGEFTVASTGETVHEHDFGSWKTTTAATCKKAGIQRRICAECRFEETQEIEKEPHTFKEGSNICKACNYVKFDDNADVVELGNVAKYEAGSVANYVWDVHIRDEKVYRGAGDYDKNSGDTDFMVFNIAESRWENAGTATDEAIHRYVEIDGKLYAPGIDSRDSGGWDLGNYYVLENNKWVKVRNVPDGIHCFDMIGYGGKMFIAVGTGSSQKVIGVSSDKGQTWTYLPMYKNGALLDASNHDEGRSRGYEFVEFGGKLYAMVMFKEGTTYTQNIFVYEGDKMVYVNAITFGNRVSRNYWQSKFEFNGKCFITAKSLYSISDFSDASTRKAYKLDTGRELATDAVVYKNTMYVLSYMTNSDGTYKTIIFKSTTGEAGSFTKVASFDYAGMPYSFDYDGNHFYVGIGQPSNADTSKAGMLLRVKPNA